QWCTRTCAVWRAWNWVIRRIHLESQRRVQWHSRCTLRARRRRMEARSGMRMRGARASTVTSTESSRGGKGQSDREVEPRAPCLTRGPAHSRSLRVRRGPFRVQGSRNVPTLRTPTSGEDSMPYIIAEPCIGVKDKACVEVCPVDCIYEGDQMLYIHPE